MGINQAGRWERFCRSVYRKIDLAAESRRARKACRKQLSALNGGYRGSKRLYRSQVTPFGPDTGSDLKRCGMTCIAIRVRSMIRGIYRRIFIGRESILRLTNPIFATHIQISASIPGCFLT